MNGPFSKANKTLIQTRFGQRIFPWISVTEAAQRSEKISFLRLRRIKQRPGYQSWICRSGHRAGVYHGGYMLWKSLAYVMVPLFVYHYNYISMYMLYMMYMMYECTRCMNVHDV